MSYEIITSEYLAKNVAKRFKEQYCSGGGWITYENSPLWPVQPEQLYEKLEAANGDTESLKSILSGGGWVKTLCLECKEYVSAAVEIQGGYESGATVCIPCLKNMVKDVESKTSNISHRIGDVTDMEDIEDMEDVYDAPPQNDERPEWRPTPSDWSEPKWGEGGRVHNWHNYVSDEIKALYPELSERVRRAIARQAEEQASAEEWD